MTAVELERTLRRVFSEQYDTVPTLLVRSPGRVNLIGEHIDYNDGFVLPMAIDRYVLIVMRPRTDRLVRLYSLDYEETLEFELDDLNREVGGWPQYAQGEAWALTEEGVPIGGFDATVGGNIPHGAGLSSSAALENGLGLALLISGDSEVSPLELAKISQRAESEWVGVKCGIMDQLASAAGQADHALLIDCRTLDIEPVTLPKGISVVVLDTATRRGLVDSAYNERREQCQQAAAAFGAPSLRDIALEVFQEKEQQLEPLLRKRARHVLYENKRTIDAARAMKIGSAELLGQLMNESHQSLRDDFEVSSKELDAMAECARTAKGCLGARMTGAGFGGCVVALVANTHLDSFMQEVPPAYAKKTSLQAAVYICQPSAGAAIEKISS